MTLKNIVKAMVPAKILVAIQNFRKRRNLKKFFLYDFRRYAAYSGRDETEEDRIALINLVCHGLEKGFTMPDFRPGFGVEKMRELLVLCDQFVAEYGATNHQFQDVVKLIYEYRLCHQRINVPVPPEIAGKIDRFLEEFPDVTSSQIQIDCTGEHYFDDIGKEFPVFAGSRHSVRSFSEVPVPMENVKQAIEIAKGAPSACNRQATRVVIISDKEKIATVFAQHGGNRGFGHTVDKLLLLCSYLPGYHNGQERNWAYVDTGIFTMNLAYALHYRKIGAVILNWNMSQERNKIIYKALDIPEYLTVVVMIAIGNLPERFKVCSSPKKELREIILER